MLVRVMHISNEKADRRVLLCRLTQVCDLIPIEVRMLVDDDLISEDIDLTDCDNSFAYVKRITFPAFYARQNKLIQELAGIEHVGTLSRKPSRFASIVSLAAWRCCSLYV